MTTPWFTLALTAALLVGCKGETDATGSDGGGGASTKVLKVGVAGPKTGGQAKNGQDLEDGATMAVEEWNARGGVLGRQVELVVRDDEALDKNATVVAGELVEEGVVGVVGHFNSGCTIPASKIYHDAGVPCITPASTNTFVTERGYTDVFRVCGRDDQQGAKAAEFIAGTLGAKKVAIYDDKTAYGKGLADVVAKQLELDGRVAIAIREGFDATERNFRPFLSKLKEADVDVWYFGGIYEQAAPMLTQARGLGITAPMMSGDGVHGYQADFLDKVGEGGNGTLTTFPDTVGAPGYADFHARYVARFEDEPGPYAVYSYAAMMILLESVEQAGSTDGAAVSAAIRAGAHETPLGPISFDAKGDVLVNPYKIWTVENGKHVLYKAE